jgi:hypothetical protein
LHQQEVDALKLKIKELDSEMQKQKDQYLRKSSAKLPSQQHLPDPELDRMRTNIRQLEEETSDLKR